jgi:hypothetical protein
MEEGIFLKIMRFNNKYYSLTQAFPLAMMPVTFSGKPCIISIILFIPHFSQ